MKKAKKFIALLLAVTMLVGVNTSYVNAENKEGCTHCIRKVGKEQCVNCSYGIPHPCSVDGRLVRCQPHYYTYQTPVNCIICGEFLFYRVRYEEVHQYPHHY